MTARRKDTLANSQVVSALALLRVAGLPPRCSMVFGGRLLRYCNRIPVNANCKSLTTRANCSFCRRECGSSLACYPLVSRKWGRQAVPLRNPVDHTATAVLTLEGSPRHVESLVGRSRSDLGLIASGAPEAKIGQSKVFPNDLDSILKAWALLAMVAAIDWVWCRRVGFTVIGISPMLCGLAMIASVGIFFEFTGRVQWLSDIANYVVLWESLALAINLYSYMVATLGFPMWDVSFARADAALGFNWAAGLHFIQSHPRFAYLLHYAYNSIFFQVLASIGFFAAIGRTDRNRELLWVAMVSALATTSLSGIFPALGPYIKEMPAWSAVLASIRAGTLALRDHRYEGRGGVPLVPYRDGGFPGLCSSAADAKLHSGGCSERIHVGVDSVCRTSLSRRCHLWNCCGNGLNPDRADGDIAPQFRDSPKRRIFSQADPRTYWDTGLNGEV